MPAGLARPHGPRSPSPSSRRRACFGRVRTRPGSTSWQRALPTIRPRPVRSSSVSARSRCPAICSTPCSQPGRTARRSATRISIAGPSRSRRSSAVHSVRTSPHCSAPASCRTRGTAAPPLDVVVRVDVTSFEADAAGDARLDACWTIRDSPTTDGAPGRVLVDRRGGRRAWRAGARRRARPCRRRARAAGGERDPLVTALFRTVRWGGGSSARARRRSDSRRAATSCIDIPAASIPPTAGTRA